MPVVERRVVIRNRKRRSGKASWLQSLLRESEPNESGDAESSRVHMLLTLTSPTPGLGGYLYGVTCASASDCWAVGFYYYSGSSNHTLIEHWDGTLWSVVTSPNPDTSGINILQAVTCASASECWAVGDYSVVGGYSTLVEKWDGTSWSIVTSPNNGSQNFLRGVTCASASDCWAVGGQSGPQTLIEHWDGTLWSVVTSPNPGDGPPQR